jgi:hypothetical protein
VVDQKTVLKHVHESRSGIEKPHLFDGRKPIAGQIETHRHLEALHRVDVSGPELVEEHPLDRVPRVAGHGRIEGRLEGLSLGRQLHPSL